jgi:hypothetical protein
MTDKHFRIHVDTTGAKPKVDDLDRSMKTVGKSADNTTFSMTKLASAIGLVVAAAGSATVLVDAQREFDKLNASLITATGSSANAALAFQAIQNLAATTPYSVNEVTQAFVKLRNLGLDPSERAIISYGNTAAAMGKDLNQMIEAVADAATGEFERLKEFGIKAKQQGDQVSFTFQGVTTTVGKNAGEIEGYLRKLGDVNFAGAMAERAKTLDGAISNLSDAFDALLLSITQSGLGDTFRDITLQITSGIQAVTAEIKSGALRKEFASIAAGIEPTIRDIVALFTKLENEFNLVSDTGIGATAFIKQAFTELGPNVRAAIQILVTELAAAADKAAAYGEMIAAAVNPFDDKDYSAAKAGLDARLDVINQARESSLESIMLERDESLKIQKQGFDDAIKLRQEYNAKVAESAKNTDVLGQFGVAGGASTTSPGDAKKAKRTAEIADEGGDKLANERNNTLVLQAELEKRSQISRAVLDAQFSDTRSYYENELALIQQDGALKTAELQRQFDEYTRQRHAQRDAQLDFYAKNGLDDSALRAEFQTQDALIAEIHEQELTTIKQTGINARAELDRAEFKSRLASFGALGSSLMALGQGHSKAIFKVGQKLALAQAAVSLPAAVLESFKNGGGYPWGLIPASTMLATGLKNIADINSAGSGLGAGGGGSVPSVSLPSGGAAATSPTIPSTAAQTTAPTQRRTVDVRIEGGWITAGQAQEILDVVLGSDDNVNMIVQAQSDAQRRGALRA